MRNPSPFLLSVLVCLLSSAAFAATYTVNPSGTGDFPTIQAAIDGVVEGDIIELTDGIFTGDDNRDKECSYDSISPQYDGRPASRSFMLPCGLCGLGALVFAALRSGFCGDP